MRIARALQLAKRTARCYTVSVEEARLRLRWLIACTHGRGGLIKNSPDRDILCY